MLPPIHVKVPPITKGEGPRSIVMFPSIHVPVVLERGGGPITTSH